MSRSRREINNNKPFTMAALVVICILLSSVQSQKTEKDWEKEFLTIPSPSQAYEHLAYYTSLPHLAGTIEDFQTAEYTKLKLIEYGFDAVIEEETVLLSYPVQRQVTLTKPSFYECVMEEDYEPTDPTSDDPRSVPTFLGYSPSGSAEGEVVYVNYGREEDYDELDKRGISVTGKIAIARYGKIFRGTKVMLAQQRGAIGMLIYSDPADDGYAQGPVYPDGPWRSNSSVQRGSVLYLSICPGNPTRDICVEEPLRDDFSYTQLMPSIPVQALSYYDAYPILLGLDGSDPAPSSFQGALPITYSLGPGPSYIQINMMMNFINTTIWNVIGTMQADNTTSPYADQQIILGNHRDAWVFGAVDPSSGSSVLLEVARSFGELKKQGWSPLRSLILASWDAEEYGLLGSTAYAERHNETIREKGVAYLNLDTAISGSSFSAISSPSLQSLIINVTKDVIDPITGLPLYNLWDHSIPPMGSGSDYTAFLDHIGLPCLNIEFDGPYGVYHSIYDSMHWMEEYGDPTFQYHVLCAQVFGLMAMRLADLPVLSFNFTDYSHALENYLDASVQLAIAFNVSLDYSSLNQSIAAFHSSAEIISDQLRSGVYNEEINQRLTYTERMFIGPGLPQRPYYKHVVQAPGLDQGYAPEVFPGVNQSIRAKDAKGAQAEIEIAAKYVNNAAVYLAGNNYLTK